VARGGFGLFYDLGYGYTGNLAGTYPFGGTRNFNNVPLPVTGEPAERPVLGALPYTSSVTAYDPDIRTPRTWQFNISVEQALGLHQSLSASYVGSRGSRQLFTVREIARSEQIRGTINRITDRGKTQYDSLQLQFRRRMRSGFQLLASYNLSRAIDTQSDDWSEFNSALELTPSLFDVRHAFSAAAVWDLPVGRGAGFWNQLIRGWSVDPIVRARSASPLSVIARQERFGDAGEQRIVYANRVPGEPVYINDRNVPNGRRLNRAAFTAPPAGAPGDSGRNAFRGFGFWQTDLAVRRTLAFERLQIHIRADVFNVFNTPMFADPVGSRLGTFDFGNRAWLTDPFFGLSTRMLGRALDSGAAGGLNQLFQAGTPRVVQLSLRLTF
jgi:hypothetical protein